MEQAAKAVRFRFSAGGCSSILPPCYCTESGRHLSRVSVKIVAIALRGLGLFGMGCGGRVFVGYVLDALSWRFAPPSPGGGGNYLGVCVGLAGGWARRYGPLPALRATLPRRGRECPGGCVGTGGGIIALRIVTNRRESLRIDARTPLDRGESLRIAVNRREILARSPRIAADRCESTRIVVNRRQNAARSRRIAANRCESTRNPR